MDNTSIQQVTEEKDLGVTIDQQLKFTRHIEASAKKANQIQGVLKRSLKYLNKRSFCNLYKAMVRPHLEYASTVWTTNTKKDKITLEKVQRRATKLIKNIRNKSYPERLLDLGLPTLEYRRLRSDMVEVFLVRRGSLDSRWCRVPTGSAVTPEVFRVQSTEGLLPADISLFHHTSSPF
ncbi:uncharacterized protein [Argopecten irradians]|uniref:uncharacterized protein n=1 Tax=Argopecten irradians TaxID=31199 RepID=UPI00372142C9